VVERRPGEPLEPAELETHMRAHLASPQIPVRFLIVDALPYTASTKVALGEVRKMVAEIVANTDPQPSASTHTRTPKRLI
jgi:acyl-CoA synthetase (AMP-forming)/AMP-acid ligase II